MGTYPMRAALLALVASTLGFLFRALTRSNPRPGRVYRIGTLPHSRGAVTTSAVPRGRGAACAHHAGRYRVKPRDFEEFATPMKEIGLYRVSRNEPPAGLEETCKA